MEYLKLIDEYKEDMSQTFEEFLEVKGLSEEPTGNEALGKRLAETLDYILNKAEKSGFETENINHFGGHIEFGGYTLDENGEIIGTSDEIMGIFTRPEVVPVVAAFYACKALKESGYIPEKKVRLILALDEGTDSKAMEQYLAKVKIPTFGFTPDGAYPVVNGEKGILMFQLAKKIGKTTGKGVELRSLKGGTTANAVADYARAVIRSDKMAVYETVKALAATYRKEKCDKEGQLAYGAKINCKGIGKSLEITTQGIGADAANPQRGVNAITVLLDFLGGLDIINDDINEFIKFYNEHIGFELDGTKMGCGFSDQVSGKLSFNPGQIELDGQAIILGVSVRFPVTVEDKAVYDGMQVTLNKYNMGIIKVKSQPPVYISLEKPFIKTLMDVYREHTGDYATEPVVSGGSTYARMVENVVAFGPNFPEQTGVHAQVESLVLNAKIFADAIYRLSQ